MNEDPAIVTIVISLAILLVASVMAVTLASAVPGLVDRMMDREQDHSNATDRHCAMIMVVSTCMLIASIFCLAACLFKLQ